MPNRTAVSFCFCYFAHISSSMSISKEVRIGLLVSSALVIFFSGFYFLKGSDLFSKEKEYYVYYPTVDGLQKSSMVQIKGINVGQVTNLELAAEKGVKVTMSIHQDINLTEGTVASLAQSDLLGTKVINLQLGASTNLIKEKAEIVGEKSGGVVDKITDELTPRLNELKGTISSFNTTLENVNSLVGEENQKAISLAVQSLKTTAENLSQLSSAINKESAQISGIIRNTNSITGNLAKSNDTVQRILSNVNRISAQLANAPIQKTIADLQKTTAELQSMMEKINSNKGSLGMLVNDKELYNNMNKSVKSLTNLTDDLKAHPGRYINISVFGGKQKK